MSEVYTSDGQSRSNSVEQFVNSLTNVPYDIDDNARVSALYNVGTFLKNAGATINVIDRDASYPVHATGHLNALATAANALGVSPALPTYISTDYNAFTSILSNIVTKVNALNLPGNTVAPVASATNLSVAGGGVASVTTGTWVNSPTFTYQWQRDGVNIAGQTTNSHTLVAGDVGHMLSCVVKGTNGNGTMIASSNAVGPVVA